MVLVMGTRALIKPLDDFGEEICTIYLQFDGYPEGIMKDVADFLSKVKLVNGLDFTEKSFLPANGMDDLTAQLIAFLKTHEGKIISGGVYVLPPKKKGLLEEYEYYIVAPKEYSECVERKRDCIPMDPIIVAYEIDFLENKKKKIFEGTAKEYLEFLNKQE